MIFDIPVNFQVVSENEPRAEQQLFDFLMKSMKEFGIEQRVSNFEYFEFVAEEPSNTG